MDQGYNWTLHSVSHCQRRRHIGTAIYIYIDIVNCLRKFPCHVLNCEYQQQQQLLIILRLNFFCESLIGTSSSAKKKRRKNTSRLLYCSAKNTTENTLDIRCRQTFICYKWFFIIELHARDKSVKILITHLIIIPETGALSALEPRWVGVGLGVWIGHIS